MKGTVVLHILIMVVGVLFLLMGAFIGAHDTQQKKISTHKALGMLGIAIFLVGFLGVLLTGNARVKLPHFYLGLGTVAFLIMAAIGGIMFTKAEAAKKQGLFKSHKADVAISVVLLVITIVFGIVGIPMLGS